MSRLLLVRHGQSTWNESGRWQGQADPPLTDLGRDQARRAAERLAADLGVPEAVWASDLERARRTADAIAAPHGLQVVVDPRVRERHAGPWEGLTRPEIDERFPGHLGQGRRPEGMETDDEVRDRVLVAFAEVLDTLGGGTGVAVTHGGVILTLERHLGAPHAPIGNLEARWLVREPDGSLVLGARVTLLD